MAAYQPTGIYSRFIALAKIVLPLAALALLSTLFLISQRSDPSNSIPYARVDVDQLVREQGVSAPNYSGVTRTGTAISVIADTARPLPDDPTRASATNLRARLDFADNSRTDITADSGELDTENDITTLNDNVVIITSQGYRIETESLTAALGRTDISTEENITATGPLGDLDAGAMSLVEDPAKPGSYLLVFKNGVKLIYQPGK